MTKSNLTCPAALHTAIVDVFDVGASNEVSLRKALSAAAEAALAAVDAGSIPALPLELKDEKALLKATQDDARLTFYTRIVAGKGRITKAHKTEAARWAALTTAAREAKDKKTGDLLEPGAMRAYNNFSQLWRRAMLDIGIRAVKERTPKAPKPKAPVEPQSSETVERLMAQAKAPVTSPVDLAAFCQTFQQQLHQLAKKGGEATATKAVRDDIAAIDAAIAKLAEHFPAKK